MLGKLMDRYLGILLLVATLALGSTYLSLSAMPVERVPDTLAWWQAFLASDSMRAPCSTIVNLLPPAASFFHLLAFAAPLLFFGYTATSFLRTGQVSLDLLSIGLYAMAFLVLETLLLGTAGHLHIAAYSTLHILLIAASVAALAWRPAPTLWRDLLAGLRATAGAIRRNPLMLVLCVVLVVQALWLLFLALVFEVSVADTRKYHLPPLFRWYQEGSFLTVNLGTPWADSYPKNINFLQLATLIATDSPAYFRFIQTLFAAAGGIACFAMARLCGVAREHALLALAAFVLTPIVLVQSTGAMVDVAVHALFVCGMVFTAHYARHHRFPSAVAGATAMGLALGAKYSMTMTAVLFGCALVAIEAARVSRGDTTYRAAMRRLAVVAVIGAALGAYWYTRNLLLFANPVWPFAVLGEPGAAFFPGTYSLDWLMKAGEWSPLMERRYGTYEAMTGWDKLMSTWLESAPVYRPAMASYGGFGAHWFIVGLPCTLLALPFALARKNLPLLVFWLTLVIAFALTNGLSIARYTIFIAALGAVSLAWIVSLQPRRQAALYAGVACFTMFFSAFVASQQYYDADVLDRAAREGRLRMEAEPWDEYDHLVPSGARVRFLTTTARDTLYFFGRDYSRIPEALPDDALSTPAGLDGWEFIVVPSDSPHSAMLKRMSRVRKAGAFGDYDVFRVRQRL